VALAAIIGVVVTRRPETAGVVSVLTLDQNPTAVALDTRAGRAFVVLEAGPPRSHGRVLIFDTRTGALLRAVTVGHALGALAVDEAAGHVYVADGLDPDGSAAGAGALYVVDEHSGSVRRVMPLAIPAAAMALDDRAKRILTVSKGGFAGNWYGSGTMAIRDTATGRTVHTGAVGIYPSSIAIDTRTERAFVSNFLGNSVSILDARNGRPLHTVTLGPPPGRVAAIVDTPARRVFALSLPPDLAGGPPPTRGGVAVIDGGTGRLLHTIAMRNPAALAVDRRTGNVVVAAGGGMLVLDGVSGRLLRTVATSLYPMAIAVDGGRARAIAITGDSAARDADPWRWMPSGLRDKLSFIPRPSVRFHAVPASVTIFDLTR